MASPFHSFVTTLWECFHELVHIMGMPVPSFVISKGFGMLQPAFWWHAFKQLNQIVESGCQLQQPTQTAPNNASTRQQATTATSSGHVVLMRPGQTPPRCSHTEGAAILHTGKSAKPRQSTHMSGVCFRMRPHAPSNTQEPKQRSSTLTQQRTTARSSAYLTKKYQSHHDKPTYTTQ